MDFLRNALRGLDQRRTLGLDLLRIYLGIGLVVRGFIFITEPQTLLAYIEQTHTWFWPLAIAHYVVLAHIGGGLLLTLGLFTRISAALQLPALAGAVLFVHAGDGLLHGGQSLELAGLVLSMLGVFALFGAGKWSLDALLNEDKLDDISALAPSVKIASEPHALPRPRAV